MKKPTNYSSPASGFTLIELIVVIVVIGILAGLSVFGFSRFQADARDAQRTSSATVLAESLEKYFDANGEYPSCTEITAPANTVNELLPNVDSAILTTPGDNTNDNSVRCETLELTSSDFFEYRGDGSSTCATGGSCISYTLRYKSEGDGEIKEIQSRRSSNVAGGNGPALALSSTGFTIVNVTWTEILNSGGYRIQVSDDSTFDGGDSIQDLPDSSAESAFQVSGLSQNTQYWIRVQALFSGGIAGQWSNTLSPTTDEISASSLIATANSGSQITADWGPVANATSYTLQQATSVSGEDLVNPTEYTTNSSTTILARTGLDPGVEYFYRVKATVSGGLESPWSNIDSAVTFVPAPVCSATPTLNSNTQITVNWQSVSVATSYRVQRSTNNSTWTNTTTTTSTSQSFSGLSNGTTYYFRVQALVGSVESTWDNCPSRTTGVSGPSSYGWSSRAYGVRAWNAVSWMPGAAKTYGNWWTNGMYIYAGCSAGASPRVQLQSYYAYSNNSSQNGTRTLSWTSSSQDRYVVGGSGSWKVWWRGWVACQANGTRYGQIYLGNAGPY